LFQLYFDEDADARSLIAALRQDGFDCLTVREARRERPTDEEQLVYATSQNRVIYTKNVGDFARLHAGWLEAGRTHAGIIVLSGQRTSISAQLRALRSLGEV